MKVRELIAELQKLDPKLPTTCQISEPIAEYEKITKVKVVEGEYWITGSKKKSGKYVIIE